ncbi:MAG: TRAP transporter substrate-binding protein [Desulfobacterales bacterium]|nr:TRAP transporter substrate-binding protein [Desulfobacterales bacterium]
MRKNRFLMRTKKNRGLVSGATIVVAALLLLVSFSAGTAAEPKAIELRFASQMPKVSLPGRAFQYFADTMEKRTKGRVKITVYPVGTLLAPDKIYEGVTTGIADIGNTTPGYTAGRFPASDSLVLPLPFKSAWVYTQVVQDWYAKFKPKEYKDTHMFYLSGCGPYTLMGRDKPVLKPEELKGLRVRAAGAQASAFVKALGGTPVAIPMPEVYDAASKGILDVLCVPAETLKAWKHADVSKYLTSLPVSFSSPNITFINLKKWNALPKDIQKVFNEVSAEMIDVLGKAWWYGDIVGVDYFLSLGGGRQTFAIPAAEVPDWEKLLAPLEKGFRPDKGGMGLPAAEYVKYLQERTAYWNKRQPDKKTCVEFVEKDLLTIN